MRSITGLAILRHTGLGYLVIQVVEDAFSLDAFQIFNLFREKTVCKNWISTSHTEFCFYVESFEGNRFKLFSDEHAAGRYTSEIPGDWHLSSTSRPRKR